MSLTNEFFFLSCFLSCCKVVWYKKKMKYNKNCSVFHNNLVRVQLGGLLRMLMFCSAVPCSAMQFSSVSQSCPALCDPMNLSTPGLPVHHQLPEFTQTHVHQVGDAIQASHPLSSPSPPAPNPSQNQSLFQWVNSSHEVAKVLEFQL